MRQISRFQIYIVLFFLLILSAILNKLVGFKINFLFIYVLFLGFYAEPRKSLECALITGFFVDILFMASYPITAILYFLVVFLTIILKDYFYKDSFLTQSIFSFIGFIAIGMMFYLTKYFSFSAQQIMPYEYSFFDYFKNIAIPYALYNLIATPPIMFSFSRIFNL